MVRNYIICSITFLSFILLLSSCKHESITSDNVVDIDGNVYKTVTIGKQVWMKENLRTTHYRNGYPILFLSDGIQWINNHELGECCVYYDDTINSKIYGVLYNWNAITDSRNICPKGWHIPSNYEWSILERTLGGAGKAGNKLREVNNLYWTAPDSNANNESGFSARGGGYRERSGYYGGLKDVGYFWSSTSYDSMYSWYFQLTANFDASYHYSVYKTFALSVRCVKDSI